MAASNSFLTKPIFWIGLAAVGGVAYVATGSDPAETSSASKPPVRRPATTKKTVVIFTQEDENASFEPVNESPQNAFKPLVARTSGGSGVSGPDMLPADFTGGDGQWVYTGSAEIDGVPVALLENRASGDGVFLKQGERWKMIRVVQITPDSLTVAGPTGNRTLKVAVEGSNLGVAAGGTGFAPMQVNPPANLQGRIGDVNVVPEAERPNNNRRRRGGDELRGTEEVPVPTGDENEIG